MTIVDEHHTMADEHIVLDRDALADEAVRRNLAPAPNLSVLLNLHEGADLRVVTDATPIEVDEFRMMNHHPFAEDNAGCNRH